MKTHHHVVPLARISLTLSRHFSLSFIASGRSSGLHPVSSHSCCMYVLAGCPAFWGVHRSTSLMSSSLLLQQCPVCLVCLTWIVFVMRGRWPYSWCFVGCCLQEWKLLWTIYFKKSKIYLLKRGNRYCTLILGKSNNQDSQRQKGGHKFKSYLSFIIISVSCCHRNNNLIYLF